MEIWITKRRAFSSKTKAKQYLVNVRKRLTAYRKSQGHIPPGPIKTDDSLMVFICGCTSYAVRLVKVE